MFSLIVYAVNNPLIAQAKCAHKIIYMLNYDAAIIRDLRGDYKFQWLEQIMKAYFKEALEEVIKEMKEQQQAKTPLLTIMDVAKRFKVTKATIHNWLNRGIITGKKVGKNRYFTEEEVRTALAKFGFLNYEKLD